MQITKFGHSCVLLDDGQAKILFDPGSYSQVPDISVDLIIITHVHSDHYNIENLEKLIKAGSPKIITNSQVKEELDKNNIGCELLEHGQTSTVNGVKVDAFGNDHAIIHPGMPKFQNTGYLINDKIFHPGDAFVLPPNQVEILFLPIVAPWSKISETLDYIT
ncbi:MAG TPA: MBL fold metallo-hydrolase, partial [Patescibacteria group bacterium]|nr:MBL fold metallo-hydrolase [Patescibacteria group bacterium]